MKIAFILSHGVISSTNGVVSQAQTWKNGLESIGHDVTLVDMWQKNDWKTFDVIHFFGFSVYMTEFIKAISNTNTNIVVSPILDPYYSITRLKIYARWGSEKFNLTNPYYGLYKIRHLIKKVFVRSNFEKKYCTKGFGFKSDTCEVIPLSFNYEELYEKPLIKESFCLHVSLLADKRKNVKRLIVAANKYNFKLVLGGKLRNDKEKQQLKSWIGNSKNVEYVGFLTDNELKLLYARAKVFALPSTYEGVGIVGLEAAYMCCDVVITKLGGPKEYYNGMAKTVDPYNVDDIGRAIKQFLEKDTFQPELSQYVIQNFSLKNIADKLSINYTTLV